MSDWSVLLIAWVVCSFPLGVIVGKMIDRGEDDDW